MKRYLGPMLIAKKRLTGFLVLMGLSLMFSMDASAQHRGGGGAGRGGGGGAPRGGFGGAPRWYEDGRRRVQGRRRIHTSSRTFGFSRVERLDRDVAERCPGAVRSELR